jgi:hypothetical protein
VHRHLAMIGIENSPRLLSINTRKTPLTSTNSVNTGPVCLKQCSWKRRTKEAVPELEHTCVMGAQLSAAGCLCDLGLLAIPLHGATNDGRVSSGQVPHEPVLVLVGRVADGLQQT